MVLKKKVAIVTGSGRGIGQAIAFRLAREGACVVVNDLDPETGDATAEQIRATGGQAVACNGDVTQTDFAERFVSTALAEFGGLDIIVNNAGYIWDSVVQKTTDEQFQAMLDVHLIAPFRILRAAAEPIRTMVKKEANEGRRVHRKVVNISSVAGIGGNAGQIGYSTAKAGIIGMTKTMQKEWGRYNVNVNTVAFGLIQTRLTRPLGGEMARIAIGDKEINVGVRQEFLDAMEQQLIPLGRVGTPEEAANGVFMFCSPDSDYIGGQLVIVGGGMSL